MAENQSPISINPEDSVAGGLATANTDATIVSSTFAMFDYNGKIANPVPSIEWELDVGEEKNYTQNWSLGDPKNFLPSNDGNTLMKVGKRDKLVKGCNGLLLLESLVNCGFPTDLMSTGRADIFTGMQVHLEDVPAPERKGIKKEKKEGGYDDTILIVTEILSMPGDEKKGKAQKPKGAPSGVKEKAAPAAAKKTAEKTTEAGGSVDVTEVSTTFMLEQIAASGEKGLSKKTLPTLTFTSFAGHPNQLDIVKKVCDDAFLSSGPWNYENGVCTLG